MKEIYRYIELPEGDHGTVIIDGMPDIFKFFTENPKTGGKIKELENCAGNPAGTLLPRESNKELCI